jgi:hypothetical protein
LFVPYFFCSSFFYFKNSLFDVVGLIRSIAIHVDFVRVFRAVSCGIAEYDEPRAQPPDPVQAEQ